MFMMPMPPTSSDTAAMLASSVVSVLRAFLLRARHLGQVADREVVVGAGREVVALAQQRRDLPLRARGRRPPSAALTMIVPAMYFFSPPWIFAWNVVDGMNTVSS